MRYIFLLIFVFTISIRGQSQVQLYSFIPDSTYRIGASVADASLPAGKGKVEFHFSSHSDYGDSISCNSKVIFSCNGRLDTADYVSLMKPTRSLTPGKYVFEFYLNDRYKEVATDTITITAGNKTPLFINFNQPPPIQFDPSIFQPRQIQIDPTQYFRYSMQEDKPVIYVYPDQTTAMSIQLQLKGKLGFTYPAYNNGWNFTADRDGSIHMNGKSYPYLFWEGETNINNASIDWENGSIVKRDSLVPFFEKNLAAAGLNEKEITDYITYWVPRMQKNDSCYIHFLMNEDYDEYATMNITPAPDTKLQLFMIWSDAKDCDRTMLAPQTFQTTERKGLTVVEWGGAEMQYIPAIFAAQASE